MLMMFRSLTTHRHDAVAVLIAVLAASAAATPLAAQEAPYDLVLRGGTVVDGTGGGMRLADVGIRGDRIVRVGNLARASSREVLDVRGRMIAPGFINVHSHANPRALGTAANLLTQGVTTVLLNADGGGPVDLQTQLAGIETAGTAVNVAASVPFNSIWSTVVGVRDVRPTDEQIGRMQQLVTAGPAHPGVGLQFCRGDAGDDGDRLRERHGAGVHAHEAAGAGPGWGTPHAR